MDTDSHRLLEALLDREIEAAESLAATLGAERAALTGSSPEAVQQKAFEKTRLLHTLEQLEDERRALAAAAKEASAGASATGPETSSLDDAGDFGPGEFGDAVSKRWRTLMELMAGCRSSNEANGYIIHTRQGHIQQLLSIVRGGTPLTYTAQGKTFARALRALAKA